MEIDINPDSIGSAHPRCGENAWLHGEISETSRMLGERTLLKEWLVACLAKTMKELAWFEENMLELSSSGELSN
ncbi:hypothetical protein LI82_00600 [Methanococcoides methylutens]|uniref:Uncharacterized protein n=1 Tax=Methanococcoides methylutens TaxID=2226 RepID=A0A099T3U4_METMT|nr:hypothetical protein [Methanococcoides methylutens]KGK99747.1 hypothetical protein LI82_00600 [Methanococcoides methylutens]